MISLKKIFHPNPCLLPFTKAEKALLECFFENKSEFENWHSFHPQHRIQFRFYFPTAVDFFFDNHKMFTAYFSKTGADVLELQEFKMSQENYTSIRSSNWQPFEEVMRSFLTTLAENNQSAFSRQIKSLHDYQDLCKNAPPQREPSKLPGLKLLLFAKTETGR